MRFREFMILALLTLGMAFALPPMATATNDSPGYVSTAAFDYEVPGATLALVPGATLAPVPMPGIDTTTKLSRLIDNSPLVAVHNRDILVPTLEVVGYDRHSRPAG